MPTDRMRSLLESRSPAFWAVAGTALVAALGWVDYATGFEISLSLFYLIPVGLTAWYSARPLALVMCALAAIAWLIADVASGHVYSMPGLHVWNMSIRLGFFIVVALLLAELRRAHAVEQRLARTDFLTGLLNSRHFTELAERELDRARRYEQPVSVAFLDVDNFKDVNDRLGHAVGDELLAAVGAELMRTTRRTDLVARLGGDEFAMLLPQADDAAARQAVVKVETALNDAMSAHEWPVTFSIGVMTFRQAPPSVTDLVIAADHLMYSVKAAGKARAAFAARAH
ncbi:MAG: GGDEF domain-containing protein [Gemmatimonadota bacterium]|nr:GGDEF domain-containing protein [Gemmatimonadota bacterium]MDE3127496.1 GGDEF domain-containing protein [Gemmatimonadota bacterium]MDE3217492.1 GGDEF domain-containing protein [Gemmatimonadota bacterium]